MGCECSSSCPLAQPQKGQRSGSSEQKNTRGEIPPETLRTVYLIRGKAEVGNLLGARRTALKMKIGRRTGFSSPGYSPPDFSCRLCFRDGGSTDVKGESTDSIEILKFLKR